MPDINFDCPHCRQNLDAPEDMAGMNVECPACGQTIHIPARMRPHRGDPPPVFKPRIDASKKQETGPIAPVDDEDKGKTALIELPKDFVLPEPKSRVVFIKRQH